MYQCKKNCCFGPKQRKMKRFFFFPTGLKIQEVDKYFNKQHFQILHSSSIQAQISTTNQKQWSQELLCWTFCSELKYLVKKENLKDWKLSLQNSILYNPDSAIKKGKLIFTRIHVQRCRQVFKSGGACSNTMDIICPLWLTEIQNSGDAKALPAPPLTTALGQIMGPKFL